MYSYLRIPSLQMVSCLLLVLLLFGESILMADDAPQILWAKKQLYEAAAKFEVKVSSLSVEVDPETLDPESYQLRVSEIGVTVIGGDANGCKFGILDLAEQLETKGDWKLVQDSNGEAEFEFRAIKFNLPWDAYRSNDAITLHYEQCRDLDYWEAWMDMMAKNRFNVLSLWNLHPWNYMIRPKGFPYATDMTDEELAEWQSLFRGIFRLAEERGIDTYLVNWNIFVSEGFAKYHGLRSRANITTVKGFSAEMEALVKQYNRECITQVLNEYPELDGVGVSLGEAMGGVTAEYREQWVQDVFVAGIEAADRPVKFIHRLPFSAGKSNGGTVSKSTEVLTREALEATQGVEYPIYTEAKFNWSHAHSSPTLVKVHGGVLTDTYWNPSPKNYKMCWMIRNEDFFFLRWGNPDFIREHIRLNGGDHVGGYYVGSECYIPAADYFTKNTEGRNWKYAFERQWLFYKTWGRLLYSPNTPDDVFSDDYQLRFGQDGEKLFQAMKIASEFPLLFTSFIDINNDKSFYAEGFLARDGSDASKFLDLDLLLRKETLDPDMLSIAEYVDFTIRGEPIPVEKITPVELADQLDANAQEALRLIVGLSADSDEMKRQEIADIRAWSALSSYLADKIRAGVKLQEYRRHRWNASDEKKYARRHMLDAIEHWEDVVDATTDVYRVVPLTHLHRDPVNVFHWSMLRDDVRADLELIDNDQY